MFANDMQTYNYYTIAERDAYGQQMKSTQAAGTVQAAIYERNKLVTDSVLFVDAEYIAISKQPLNDNMLVEYNGVLLKVLYSMSRGSFKQSFLQRMGGAS